MMVVFSHRGGGGGGGGGWVGNALEEVFGEVGRAGSSSNGLLMGSDSVFRESPSAYCYKGDKLYPHRAANC